MKKILIGIILLIAMLTACSREASASLNGEWRLVLYGDPADPMPAARDAGAFIEFKDGQLDGNVGCNGFGGDYNIEGETIVFGQIRSTLMFCEGPVGDQESATFNVLQDAASYTLEGDTLTITSADGSSAIDLARK